MSDTEKIRAIYREEGPIHAIIRFRSDKECSLKEARDAIESMVTAEDRTEWRRRNGILAVDQEHRCMMHQRGFGDGANGSAQKSPEDLDYMEGWTAGMNAARDYMAAASRKYAFAQPQIIREQG